MLESNTTVGDEQNSAAEDAPIVQDEQVEDDAIVEIGEEEVPLADGTDEDSSVEIEDEDVPLGVVEDEEDTETTIIEDEETPLASNANAKDTKKSWWWWIILIVAAITGKTIHDKKVAGDEKKEE